MVLFQTLAGALRGPYAAAGLSTMAVTLAYTPSEARAELPPGCVHDATLDAVAAFASTADHTPTAAELIDRAHEAGSTVPSLHALVTAVGDQRGATAWTEALVDRGLGPLACGEATEHERRWLVAAPRQGSLRRTRTGVAVTLAPGFHDPIVYVLDRDGASVALPVEDGRVEIAEFGDVVRVQLVARGPDGPRPVAELDVAATHIVSVAEFGGDGDVDTQFGDALESLRRATHRSNLRSNRLLAREARSHVDAVCRSGHVAHRVDGELPDSRLAETGLRARHVGEVVARGATPGGAWDALLESPSHRATLGDERFTDVGIATAHDGSGRTCVVVLLAAWPRWVL